MAIAACSRVCLPFSLLLQFKRIFWQMSSKHTPKSIQTARHQQDLETTRQLNSQSQPFRTNEPYPLFPGTTRRKNIQTDIPTTTNGNLDNSTTSGGPVIQRSRYPNAYAPASLSTNSLSIDPKIEMARKTENPPNYSKFTLLITTKLDSRLPSF